MDASCMGWWSNPIQFQSDYNLTDVMAREIDRTWWPETSMNGHTTYCVRTRRTYIFPGHHRRPQQNKQKTRRERIDGWIDRCASLRRPARASRRSTDLDSLLLWSRSIDPNPTITSLHDQLARSIAPSPFRHFSVALLFHRSDKEIPDGWGDAWCLAEFRSTNLIDRICVAGSIQR
jgi:hypothetical protein